MADAERGKLLVPNPPNVWEDKKLLNITQEAIDSPNPGHACYGPLEEYENGHILVSQKCLKNWAAQAVKVIWRRPMRQTKALWQHWSLDVIQRWRMTICEALKAANV